MTPTLCQRAGPDRVAHPDGLERYLVLRYLQKVKEKFQVTPFAIAGDVRLGFVFLKKPEE